MEELPEVMGYLRARGVKGYVALNVLVSRAGTAALQLARTAALKLAAFKTPSAQWRPSRAAKFQRTLLCYKGHR